MAITTPQVTLDNLPNINTQNFDIRVIAQMLNDELTTKLNPLSPDANISFIEDHNFVKNSLNIDQFKVLEDFYKSAADDIDVQKLQELELIMSMLDLQDVPNLSPYELYALLIILGAFIG